MHSALVVLVVLVEALLLAGLWRTLVKAGEPGWGALVPGYNLYLYIKIACLPWLWLLYCLIPFVNLVFPLIVFAKICESFSLHVGYASGLLFLPFIFFPVIGFGRYKFQFTSE